MGTGTVVGETEQAVPAYGLSGLGRGGWRLGGVSAELVVRGGKVAVGWRDAAGRAVRGVPACVRREQAGELGLLRAAVREIEEALGAQGARLEREFLRRRPWGYGDWRERCLDHPLVGTLARRLLWTVDGVACAHTDGALRTLTGEPVGGGVAVELWHPLGRDRAEIDAWRAELERHGIMQPFPQAYREVCAAGPLTGRLLREDRFHAWAGALGWRYTPGDGGHALALATRDLPHWGVRAELPVEAVRYAGGRALALGALRWHPLGTAGVPPLVAGEVARDLGLLVDAAGIGRVAAPPGGRDRALWASCAFGELTPGARTRRDVLTRILPRLALSDRCRIEGRFLHVRGVRHTYRIHLGSAHVLLPDDRHLPVALPAARAPEPSWLPHEGDRTLPVILGKAALLARDTQITDPTIVSRL
ncbi:DUF4132 domain-containing protein [Streptomyces sp. NPDC058691]|uniref:DUF4132 domain-containing protein n=1 Tax=Streptomyces sp. NPDC058691 TaxID=3346601 RepID=UPI003659E07C